MSRYLEQIRSAGYVAGERGLPREHNPHSHGSVEWRYWEDGRLEAESDFLKSHSVNSSLAEFTFWMVITALVVGVLLVIEKVMDWIFSFV